MKEVRIMKHTVKDDIPYFLTKEYGEKQRKLRRNMLITIVMLGLSVLAMKVILF